jgi:predicted RNase H-like HicB family nuclease
MRYAVVIEYSGKNYAAYVPDLPGCVATADTIDAVKAEISKVIRFHINGMIEDGIEVPSPTSQVEYIAA